MTATITTQKIVKVATGLKAVLGNPFVGDTESIKQAFRQWLWLVHQGEDTAEAASKVINRNSITMDFNSKWVAPTRVKLMSKLNELVKQFQDNHELVTGTEAHAEVIVRYVEWRSRSVHLVESNNP